MARAAAARPESRPAPQARFEGSANALSRRAPSRRSAKMVNLAEGDAAVKRSGASNALDGNRICDKITKRRA
ncbi:MAG: hypothetical protein A3G24_04270 [Betaproteobacteria bacterium RIFCSPLOWO2_12_FULL_62_13]|nr:MAG: hypothetical protein A3G24_04270 [Betaproteobacteria bacterium RIFCSPLOWO2_12_FULL_62_13]